MGAGNRSRTLEADGSQSGGRWIDVLSPPKISAGSWKNVPPPNLRGQGGSTSASHILETFASLWLVAGDKADANLWPKFPPEESSPQD